MNKADKRYNRIIAIIPARGGSKGIPRKNVLLIGGKPLIAHTIEQALRSQYIDRVFVSTNDQEIASTSKKYGAEVILRPEEISGDDASSELTLLHAIEYFQKSECYTPDLIVFLQCTSPLMLAEDIDGTIISLIESGADTALSVTPFHYFLWGVDQNKNAWGINHDKKIRLRRQDRTSQYLETGSIYVMRTEGFLKIRHRFFGKTGLYVMPAERTLEIDELYDLEIADVLLRRREQSRKADLLPNTTSALVLDFDGVFTDNKVIVFQDGKEAVYCNRSDGWGLSQIKKAGLAILVISTEINPVVQARCKKLNIPCLQGIDDKLSALRSWCKKQGIEMAQVVYLGNDSNDVFCLQAVGCGVVVNDAHPEAKGVARIILNTKGGKGAIRELCDLIEQRRKK